MQHDQQELDNVSENVLRDMRSFTDRDRLKKLIQRAARHYAKYMVDEVWSEKFIELRADLLTANERIVKLERTQAELSHVINDLSARLDLTPGDISDLRKRLTGKE